MVGLHHPPVDKRWTPLVRVARHHPAVRWPPPPQRLERDDGAAHVRGDAGQVRPDVVVGFADKLHRLARVRYHTCRLCKTRRTHGPVRACLRRRPRRRGALEPEHKRAQRPDPAREVGGRVDEDHVGVDARLVARGVRRADAAHDEARQQTSRFTPPRRAYARTVLGACLIR